MNDAEFIAVFTEHGLLDEGEDENEELLPARWRDRYFEYM